MLDGSSIILHTNDVNIRKDINCKTYIDSFNKIINDENKDVIREYLFLVLKYYTRYICFSFFSDNFTDLLHKYMIDYYNKKYNDNIKKAGGYILFKVPDEFTKNLNNHINKFYDYLETNVKLYDEINKLNTITEKNDKYETNKRELLKKVSILDSGFKFYSRNIYNEVYIIIANIISDNIDVIDNISLKLLSGYINHIVEINVEIFYKLRKDYIDLFLESGFYVDKFNKSDKVKNYISEYTNYNQYFKDGIDKYIINADNTKVFKIISEFFEKNYIKINYYEYSTIDSLYDKFKEKFTSLNSSTLKKILLDSSDTKKGEFIEDYENLKMDNFYNAIKYIIDYRKDLFISNCYDPYNLIQIITLCDKFIILENIKEEKLDLAKKQLLRELKLYINKNNSGIYTYNGLSHYNCDIFKHIKNIYKYLNDDNDVNNTINTSSIDKNIVDIYKVWVLTVDEKDIKNIANKINNQGDTLNNQGFIKLEKINDDELNILKSSLNVLKYHFRYIIRSNFYSESIDSTNIEYHFSVSEIIRYVKKKYDCITLIVDMQKIINICRNDENNNSLNVLNDIIYLSFIIYDINNKIFNIDHQHNIYYIVQKSYYNIIINKKIELCYEDIYRYFFTNEEDRKENAELFYSNLEKSNLIPEINIANSKSKLIKYIANGFKRGSCFINSIKNSKDYFRSFVVTSTFVNNLNSINKLNKKNYINNNILNSLLFIFSVDKYLLNTELTNILDNATYLNINNITPKIFDMVFEGWYGFFLDNFKLYLNNINKMYKRNIAVKCEVNSIQIRLKEKKKVKKFISLIYKNTSFINAFDAQLLQDMCSKVSLDSIEEEYINSISSLTNIIDIYNANDSLVKKYVNSII